MGIMIKFIGTNMLMLLWIFIYINVSLFFALIKTHDLTQVSTCLFKTAEPLNIWVWCVPHHAKTLKGSYHYLQELALTCLASPLTSL
jgi:hypothetical protein